MNFSRRHAIQKLRSRRQRYFRVDREIPSRIFFRNSNRFFWQILFLGVLFSLLYWKLISSGRSISLIMTMFVLSVFLFGFTLKFLLSIIFPEVTLDEEGIKLRGIRKIGWAEIKALKIDPTFDLYADIKLKNGTLIHHRIEFSNAEKLRMKVRSFFRKYRHQ